MLGKHTTLATQHLTHLIKKEKSGKVTDFFVFKPSAQPAFRLRQRKTSLKTQHSIILTLSIIAKNSLNYTELKSFIYQFELTPSGHELIFTKSCFDVLHRRGFLVLTKTWKFT